MRTLEDDPCRARTNEGRLTCEEHERLGLLVDRTETNY